MRTPSRALLSTLVPALVAGLVALTPATVPSYGVPLAPSASFATEPGLRMEPVLHDRLRVVAGHRTVVRSLRLARLPEATTVELRCQGATCPFDRKVLRAAGPRLDVTRHFRQRRLAPATRITAHLTAPGYAWHEIWIRTRGRHLPMMAGEAWGL